VKRANGLSLTQCFIGRNRRPPGTFCIQGHDGVYTGVKLSDLLEKSIERFDRSQPSFPYGKSQRCGILKNNVDAYAL
jgi:hypothetical protein